MNEYKEYRLMLNGKMNFQSSSLERVKAKAFDEKQLYPELDWQIEEVLEGEWMCQEK